MASLANMINNEGDSDFVQAPHHFELWTLAEVHESGEVIAAKEFICDCAGLVRKNLRDPGEPGDYTRETTPPRRTAPPSSHNQHAGTQSDSLRQRRQQRLSRLNNHIKNLKEYIDSLKG